MAALSELLKERRQEVAEFEILQLKGDAIREMEQQAIAEEVNGVSVIHTAGKGVEIGRDVSEPELKRKIEYTENDYYEISMEGRGTGDLLLSNAEAFYRELQDMRL